MYKKFFTLLCLGAAVILCCMACREQQQLPGTTTGAQGNAGAVDSPWGTTESQTAQPSKGSPLPGEDGTVSTQSTVQPTPSTTEATQPTTEATQPTQTVTQPTQGAPDTAMTYEAFLELDAHGKQVHMESFPKHEDFINWLVAAKAVYDEEHPAIEVDGTGAYTVPQ